MPYTQYLFCERCGEGHQLDLDYQGTIEAYQADGRPSPAVTSPTLIWDYIIYACGSCQTRFKYTYREVEFRVRTYLSNLSVKYKEYLDSLAEYNKTESERKSGEFFVKKDSELRKRLTERYSRK